MNATIQNLAEKLQQGDPDRFLAVMSMPVKYRETAFVIYAFNLEIARIPYLTSEPMIAQMRLEAQKVGPCLAFRDRGSQKISRVEHW